DRGTCTFVQKARNAQAAGAIGLVIVNNAAGAFPSPMNGTAPDVTIPLVQINLATGDAVKAALAGFEIATAGLMLSEPTPMGGADVEGRPMLFTPKPVSIGSTDSHWDTSLTPNQLMQPNYAPDLTQSVEPPNDLTLSVFRDMGWFSDYDGVPDGGDQRPGC